MKKKRKQILQQWLPGYAFLLPGLLFVLVYMGYPLLRSFYLSFTNYNFAFDPEPVWTGMSNYVNLFQDAKFLASLKNTAIFSAAFFPSVLVLSLLIALLLDKAVRGSVFFRTFIFMPMIVPLSLTGIVFQWILNERYGLLNSLLYSIGLGNWAINWLGDGTWAMVSIVIVSLWKNIGMLVIFFMGGLQAIPNDVIEASRMDGAGSIRRLFSIILPNLRETFVICGIWAIIQSVKVFEQPFIMTNGGPGTATLVLYQYTWINAFKHFEMGYASAIAYFIGAIIIVLSLFNMYLNRSEDVRDRKRLERLERRERRLAK